MKKVKLMDEPEVARGKPELAADEFLSGEELSKRLGVCTLTLANWRKAGHLPYVVLGRSVRYCWGSVVAALKRAERNGGAA